MNRGPAPGRERDNETVEERTGEIRYEARCSRETDAEANSIRETEMGGEYARTGGSRLRVRPEHDLQTNDGP